MNLTLLWRTGSAPVIWALLLAPQLLRAESSLCQTGRKQSPVDIVTPVKKKLAALDFQYRQSPLRIANDGHTARVRIAKGSRLRIGKESYTLQQFHFHTPGGDRIAGEEFPMAAHLLHKSQSGQLCNLIIS